MSSFVAKQARRARRSTSSKLSPTQRLNGVDTGDACASKSWFFLQIMKRMKNERERFYLLLWKCAVLEASFPINLEYPSYSALSSTEDFLQNILWSQNSEISYILSLVKEFVRCEQVKCATQRDQTMWTSIRASQVHKRLLLFQ